MIGCNCQVTVDLVALFKEEILQCLFPRKKEKELKGKMKQLAKMKEGIYKRVEKEKQTRPGMRCKVIVDRWGKDVSDFEVEKTNLIEKSIQEIRGTRHCCSCSRSYSLGGNIIEMLRQIDILLETGRGFETADLFEEAPLEAVEEQPISPTVIVGTEGKLSEMTAHLNDEKVGIIGVYGAGGIGKTTIMKQLNNMMLNYQNAQKFVVVIWVTVSQDVNIYEIQKQINSRLGLRDFPEDLKDRAAALCKVLKPKKYLILLDDLWKQLHLTEVGIPVPGDGISGKLVFTTRSHEVCVDMGANKYVKVDFLTAGKSWELFSTNLGPEVDLVNIPKIQECAFKVADRCRGLPLALITVAKAFGSYKNDVFGWESGLQTLMDSPSEIRGMEDILLSLLKFSFDRLRNRDLQLCLLYLSLYPYDYDINIKFITELWVGEELLSSSRGRKESFYSMRKRALDYTTQLKSASLLERSILGDMYVTMHDSIRDMCLWVTRTCNMSLTSTYGNFLLYNTVENSKHINFDMWETSTKVSFIRSRIKYLGTESSEGNSKYHNLVTLLLNECRSLNTIQDDFFQFTPSLRVLDLSRANLKELPKSIFLLVELRYLNLKATKIERLPKEMGNLRNLRHLYIEETLNLRYIPREALSNLLMLQCLSVLTSAFLWGLNDSEDGVDPSIQLPELKKLTALDELGLDIRYASALDELLQHFSSDNSEIIELQLLGREFTDTHVSNAYSSFLRMRRFWISSCFNVEELVFREGYDSCLEEIVLMNNTKLRSIIVKGEEKAHEGVNAQVPHISRELRFPLARLREIFAQRCHLIEDLSCIWHIPTLEWIRLHDCNGLQVIIPATVAGNRVTPCPKLQFLELNNLPSLKMISSLKMRFPSFQILQVRHCPELKKLPFDYESANNIKRISGSREWLGSIEWDDDNIRSVLLGHYQSYS